ncbi:phospholipase D-like domain-containing protein [Gordonia sp. CPCC 205333]
MAVIVDAADYFAHAKSALRQAERRAMLIGWDFDRRIHLDPREPEDGVPDELGAFIGWLRREKPDLEIYILKWSVEALAGITRGSLPYFVQNILSGKRIHLHADDAHPLGSAHHQKIVVIDDEFAFCGGIDMTLNRWDTSDHLPDNDFRTGPDGEQHDPWHDVTVALDSEAAHIVADVARARWESATGERLEPLSGNRAAIWPVGLTPTFTGPDVGIARTIPEYGERAEIYEIRNLHLAAIAAAQRTLYIESQYLASQHMADALATRLAEPDGPEIVVVLPRHADSDVERKVMDGARQSLLSKLWESDRHNRFRAYYPVTAVGGPIYVHAKVLIVDDTLLRIGSSNLNNRSMGFDSECDVAVEADPNSVADQELRRTITSVRTRLLAEHLDIDPDVLDETIASSSMIAAIDSLLTDAKSLRVFTPETVADEGSALAHSELFDPTDARATRLERIMRGFLRR